MNRSSKEMKFRYGIVLLTILLIVLGVLSCTEEPKDPETNLLVSYFPGEVTGFGIVRSGAIESFVGDSLYEYIDGGAELYHEYNFEQVSTAEYKVQKEELILDMYQFADPVGAFGLYSRLRPDHADFINFGVEGYTSSTSLDFVKDEFLVRITAFDSSKTSRDGMEALAAALDDVLPGVKTPPPLFANFPTDSMVAHSQKIFAHAFLEHPFLDSVYTVDYSWDTLTFTLLLAPDAHAARYKEWAALPGAEVLDKAPLEEGHAAIVKDDYYGEIIAGPTAGYLIGMLGYRPELRQFLADWTASLGK